MSRSGRRAGDGPRESTELRTGVRAGVRAIEGMIELSVSRHRTFNLWINPPMYGFCYFADMGSVTYRAVGCAMWPPTYDSLPDSRSGATMVLTDGNECGHAADESRRV